MLVAVVIDEFRLLAANLFLGSKVEINDRRLLTGSEDRTPYLTEIDYRLRLNGRRFYSVL